MAFDNVQFPTAQTGNRFILMVKIAIGRFISWVAPDFAARVAAGQMPPRIGFLERSVIAYQVHRHVEAGTLDQLAPLHAWLWSGEQAVSFHEQAKARFDSFWLAHHSAIIEPIRLLFEPDPSSGLSAYRRLCEIGCGSGLVLEDIARRLQNVPLLDRKSVV